MVQCLKNTSIPFTPKELCFPNQLLQPNNSSGIFPGKTHWIPKEQKTKPHNPNTWGQCNNKWFIVSPSHRHIQHQTANWYPLRIRLTKIKILPQVAIHAKKETRLGALRLIKICYQTWFYIHVWWCPLELLKLLEVWRASSRVGQKAPRLCARIIVVISVYKCTFLFYLLIF